MPKQISNKNAKGEGKLHRSGKSERKKHRREARDEEKKAAKKARKRMRRLAKLRQREQMSFGVSYENAYGNNADHVWCVRENNENREDISGSRHESSMVDQESIQLAEQRALDQWMAEQDALTWSNGSSTNKAPNFEYDMDEAFLAEPNLVEIMPGTYQSVEKYPLAPENQAETNEINNEMQGEVFNDYETAANDNTEIAIQNNEMLTDNVGRTAMSFKEETNAVSELPIAANFPIVIELDLSNIDFGLHQYTYNNMYNVAEEEAKTETQAEAQAKAQAEAQTEAETQAQVAELPEREEELTQALLTPPSVVENVQVDAAIDFEAEIDKLMSQPSSKQRTNQKLKMEEEMAEATASGSFLGSYVGMLHNIEASMQKDYTELVQVGGKKSRTKRKYADGEKKPKPKKRKTKEINKALENYYRRVWLTAPMRNYHDDLDLDEIEAEI